MCVQNFEFWQDLHFLKEADEEQKSPKEKEVWVQQLLPKQRKAQEECQQLEMPLKNAWPGGAESYYENWQPQTTEEHETTRTR